MHLAENCESTPFFPSVNVTLPVALVQMLALRQSG